MPYCFGICDCCNKSDNASQHDAPAITMEGLPPSWHLVETPYEAQPTPLHSLIKDGKGESLTDSVSEATVALSEETTAVSPALPAEATGVGAFLAVHCYDPSAIDLIRTKSIQMHHKKLIEIFGREKAMDENRRRTTKWDSLATNGIARFADEFGTQIIHEFFFALHAWQDRQEEHRTIQCAIEKLAPGSTWVYNRPRAVTSLENARDALDGLLPGERVMKALRKVETALESFESEDWLGLTNKLVDSNSRMVLHVVSAWAETSANRRAFEDVHDIDGGLKVAMDVLGPYV